MARLPLLRVAVATTATTAAALLTASGAAAQHLAVGDPARDVVATSTDVLPKPVQPHVTDGDVTRAVLRHTKTAIVRHAYFRDLKRTGRHRWALTRLAWEYGSRHLHTTGKARCT